MDKFVAHLILFAWGFVFPFAVQAAAPEQVKGTALKCELLPGKEGRAVVCVSTAESDLNTKDLLTLGASALALLISFAALVYAYKKDRRTRRQSVEDDYWVRQIFGPIAIEPLIKGMLDSISKLPPDCDSASWQQPSFRKFTRRFHSQHRQLISAVHTLALLDKELCKLALKSLDTVEDAVINYCASNAGKYRNAQGRSQLSQVEVHEKIRAELFVILKAIKDFQVTQL